MIKMVKKMKYFISIICTILIALSIAFLNPISNWLTNFITRNNTLVVKSGNEYEKHSDYYYVQNTDDFVPYSYQDLKNIIYTTINKGWTSFTFYCPNEYDNCIKDITTISDDEVVLTHLNNFVHPFNSFTNIKTTISESGEINLDINYLYQNDQIIKINDKVASLIKELITDDMDDYDKIKVIHDYIINHTKYDVERNNNSDSNYNSYIAMGPLFDGYATCNGYTDLMAIFLTKLGYNNFKVATTPDEISYSSTGHIWNAVYYNNSWVHLDLTWDDPVSSDNKDYLYHTYFLVNSEELKKADDGKVKIEEHQFDKSIYYELA